MLHRQPNAAPASARARSVACSRPRSSAVARPRERAARRRPLARSMRRVRPFCGHTGTRCLPGNAKPAVCSGFRCGACRARTGDPQLAKPSGGDSGEGGSDPERPRLAGDSDEDDPALAGADPGASDRAVGQAFGWYRAPYVDDDPRSQRGPSRGTRRTPVVQAMFRRANAIPPKPAGPRKRCTRGWKGQSCKRRTCGVCGVVWARDWRRVLFEALQAPGVPVVLSAVTPPGANHLPWDEWHCRHLGPHRHSARLGCRVEGEALAGGRRTCRNAGRWFTTVRDSRASARWGGVFRSR